QCTQYVPIERVYKVETMETVTPI
ncbi:MAG: hypothetical protein RL546_475, partial [Chloroflexota bacterium]